MRASSPEEDRVGNRTPRRELFIVHVARGGMYELSFVFVADKSMRDAILEWIQIVIPL